MEDDEVNRRLASLRGKPWRKPPHGPCCCCQTCGWWNDECQCEYTWNVHLIAEIEAEIGHDAGLRFDYVKELLNAVGGIMGISFEPKCGDIVFSLATATPKQRAVALINVLEKLDVAKT